ncbi:SprT-like domain-containing protein [Luteolibacter algae]|uniref:SprT-like domain-containing protein n=1 Tax=Luteolibacter algae TaxID=454151 RepID=A0ABW5D4W9_9BACT
MADGSVQPEFPWPAWMRRARLVPEKPPAPRKTPEAPANADSELSNWCREKATELALPELSAKVCVVWNPRMRTTAGRAWWPTGKIELNPKLRDFSTDEVWQTLKHELAHLIAYQRSGRRKIQPHGIEWQKACADLGIAGESVRHSLPLKGRRMERKLAYACPVCRSVVRRVRPPKRAIACYQCCREHNGGRFHERFELIKVPGDSA